MNMFDDTSAIHSGQNCENQQSEVDTTPIFTLSEWRQMFALRHRYQMDRDLFNRQELERLRFTRWLYTTGRLTA